MTKKKNLGHLTESGMMRLEILLHEVYTQGYKSGVRGMEDRMEHICDEYSYDPPKLQRMMHIASGDLRSLIDEDEESLKRRAQHVVHKDDIID
jgi:hypothetical protein